VSETHRFKTDDVIQYTPAGRTATGSPDYYFRAGTAIVQPDGRALDTFTRSEPHVLRDTELATGRLLFNTLGETWETRNRIGFWSEHRPEDRQELSHGQGNQPTLYLRKGATPDLDTKIANARAEVEQAEQKLCGAESDLRWRREQLAKLEADQAEAANA